MDEYDGEGVSRRKEPASSSSCATHDFRSPGEGGVVGDKTYPFALVLRLRVLQIVLGISTLVMGTVGIIEERGQVNLGLGLPAGGLTVLAAAASIHTSRGFGGYQSGPALRCCPGASLRVAGPLLALWAAATVLHAALVVQAARTLARPAPHDLLVLAAVELGLALATAAAAAAALTVDCKYDPD